MSIIFQKRLAWIAGKRSEAQNTNFLSAGLYIIRAAPLLQKIPDVVVTKQFVDVIQCVVDSYLDKQLKPLHRVEYGMHILCTLLRSVDSFISTLYFATEFHHK